jgi:hypothetical protein
MMSSQVSSSKFLDLVFNSQLTATRESHVLVQ